MRDRVKYVPPKGIPEFMTKHIEENREKWLAESMREDPQFFINAAMYAANNIFKNDRGLLLEEALKLKDIQVLGEWKAEMGMYPTAEMGKDDAKRTRNSNMPPPSPDLPFRAFYLLEAVVKLLEIVNAPAAMGSDLRLFMESRLPRTAAERAMMQKALIDHPTWSDTKIAKKYVYDQTRMRKEIANGQLRRYPIIDDNADKA